MLAVRTSNSNRLITAILAILIFGFGIYTIQNAAQGNLNSKTLFPLLAILVVTAIAIDFYTLLCIIVAIAAFNYLPLLFNPVGPRVGGQPVYMLILRDILLLLLFANWFGRRIFDRERRHTPSAISKFLIFYCIYIILRAAATPTALMASVRFLRYLVLYPLVLTFIVPHAFRNKRDIGRFLWIFIIIGFIVAVIGIVEATTDFGKTYQTISGRYELYHADARAVSTLANPNNLACYLGIIIGVAISLVVEGIMKSWFRRLFVALLICAALICLFLTFSRGGILAAVLTVTLLFGIRGVKNRRISFILIMVIVIIAGYIMFYHANRARGMYIQELYAQDRRVELFWQAAEKVTSDPLVFLFGYGIAAGFRPGSIEQVAASSGSMLADNMFVMIWSEAGTIGLFAFLSLIFVILRESERIYSRQSDPYLRAGCSAVFTSVLCITIWGIGAVSFSLFPSGYYVWMFVGMLIAVKRIKEAEVANSVHQTGKLSSETKPVPIA